MERWWNYHYPEKSKYSENKSQSHFVHYKSHKDCSMIEPAPTAEGAGD